MLRKLPAFILLAFSSCAIIYSQKTPEPSKQPDKQVKPMVWSFPFDGSYLGIEPQEINKENFGKYGLSEVRGVGIEKVLENSPAAKAGLQAGDVIVKFENEEITSVRKLTRLISEVAPDHQVKLTVLRGGSEREISVTMGKREMPNMFDGNFKMKMNLPNFPKMPDMPKMPQIQITPPNEKGDLWVWKGEDFFVGSNRQIGIGVTSLTKQLGEYFGVPEGKGLLINNVRENSPAAKAGLKAGDIIVEVEGKEIKGNGDLVRALNEKKEGDVTLTIIRDKNRQTVQVTPERIKGEFTPLIEGNWPNANFQIKTPQPVVAPVVTVQPQPVPMPKRIL